MFRGKNFDTKNSSSLEYMDQVLKTFGVIVLMDNCSAHFGNNGPELDQNLTGEIRHLSKLHIVNNKHSHYKGVLGTKVHE